jgi:hypothetical protein
MSRENIIELRKDGEPVKRSTSVGEMARNLGVDFKPESLQLTCVKLARHVEQLQFEVALLRHELRKPMWRRVADTLKGSGEQR